MEGEYSEHTQSAIPQSVDRGTAWRDNTLQWMKNLDAKDPKTLELQHAAKPQWLIDNGKAVSSVGTDRKLPIPERVYTEYAGVFRITDPTLVAEATHKSITVAQQKHQPGINMAAANFAAASEVRQAVVKQTIAPPPIPK